jgi:hypothetical protein
VQLRHRQPLAERQRLVQRLRPDVLQQKLADRGDLDQVVDGPLPRRRHEDAAGGAVDLVHVGRQTAELEGELLTENGTNLVAQPWSEVFTAQVDFEARPPPVVHGARRVEAECLAAGAQQPRRMAEPWEACGEDRRNGVGVEAAAELQAWDKRSLHVRV